MIRTVRGTPMLHINGQPTAPILWGYWYGNYRRYADYSATGVKIHRPLLSGSAICAPGEEEEYYPRWFAEVDRMIQAALDVDPEIRVLPALWMDPNPQVLFEQPRGSDGERSGPGGDPPDAHLPGCVSGATDVSCRTVAAAGRGGLRRLVEHMKKQPYAHGLVGLCLFAGRAGELLRRQQANIFMNEQGQVDARPRDQWDVGDFSAAARVVFREFLVRKYGTDEALQAAWCRGNPASMIFSRRRAFRARRSATSW